MREQHLRDTLSMLGEGPFIGPNEVALSYGCNSLLLRDGSWQILEFERFNAGCNRSRRDNKYLLARMREIGDLFNQMADYLKIEPYSLRGEHSTTNLHDNTLDTSYKVLSQEGFDWIALLMGTKAR